MICEFDWYNVECVYRWQTCVGTSKVLDINAKFDCQIEKCMRVS